MREVRSEAAANGNERAEAPLPGLLQRLVSVSQAIRALLQLRLAELGLSNGQDEILMGLAEKTPISAAALAVQLDLRPRQVVLLLDGLAEKGLVDTIGMSRDPRRTMIQLTAAGLAKQAAVRSLWQELNRDLQPPDGKPQIDRLNDVLTLLRDRMDPPGLAAPGDGRGE